MHSTTTIATPYLKKLINQAKPLFLSQSINGLSITHTVIYLRDQAQGLILRTSSNLLCLCKGNQAYLHGDSIRKVFMGKILDFNLNSGELLFAELNMLNSKWKKRKEQRIHSPQPIHGFLQIGSEKLRGNVENLSLHGASMLIGSHDLKTVEIQSNQTTLIEFKLPDGKKLTIDGIVINRNSISKNLTRMGLLLNPQPAEEQILRRYLNGFYEEIVSAMDLACQNLFEFPLTQDLYF